MYSLPSTPTHGMPGNCNTLPLTVLLRTSDPSLPVIGFHPAMDTRAAELVCVGDAYNDRRIRYELLTVHTNIDWLSEVQVKQLTMHTHKNGHGGWRYKIQLQF